MIDYQLGKDEFGRYMKELENGGLSLENSSLQEAIKHRANLCMTLESAVFNALKDGVEPDKVEFIMNSLDDMIDITRQAVILNVIKQMLYGKDDANVNNLS